MKTKGNNRPRFGTRDPDEMMRLVKLMKDITDELGRVVKKSDLSNKELGEIRSCFGKWCYALEASGLHVPSPETIERRLNSKTRAGRKKAAQKERIRQKFLQQGDIQPKENVD